MKNSRISTIFMILIGICLLNNSNYAQTGTKKTITLELANKIITACKEEAVKNDFKMVIAVVDDGGNLVAFERMDNAQLGSIDVAIEKAKTAIFFRRPTKSYEERVTAGNNAILKVPNILPFEGGIPIVIDNEYIGAVGVSGGSPQQDGMVAQAGVKVIEIK